MPLNNYKKQLEYNRKYRRKNPEKSRGWSRKNYQKNKETAKRYWRSPKGKYNHARCTAKHRGITWDIDFNSYTILITKPCYYCGASILTNSGVGLDRVDNKHGYTPDNVLPSCGPCNESRMDHFTVSEFKVMITALLRYRKIKSKMRE